MGRSLMIQSYQVLIDDLAYSILDLAGTWTLLHKSRAWAKVRPLLNEIVTL